VSSVIGAKHASKKRQLRRHKRPKLVMVAALR
jgi:hypothetical protein